ncbi:MAG: helicase HerA domain-containing protein, partial [Mycobacteriales bacterium]
QLPPATLPVPYLVRAGARQRSPAGALPPGALVLAEATGLGTGRPVGLTVAELASHAYLLGPSGTGKTTLLARLVTEAGGAGIGLVVLDPHGDLTRQVLSLLPAQVLARAAVVDLTEPAAVPVINPLWLPPCADPARAAVARSIRSAAVTAVFADLWGLARATTPNLLHFLQAALAALVGAGGASLADLPRFLTDAAFRAGVVRRSGDERVRRRWAEFAALRPDDRSRTVRAILNKAGEFDRNPVLATVFGDPGPGLRLDEVMDSGQLLLVNLPRGLVPEGTVEVVGSLVVTLLHQAALAREARPPEERPLCLAVIDEFQEFALRAFASVVTSTRKYGLGLVVANRGK